MKSICDLMWWGIGWFVIPGVCFAVVSVVSLGEAKWLGGFGLTALLLSILLAENRRPFRRLLIPWVPDSELGLSHSHFSRIFYLVSWWAVGNWAHTVYKALGKKSLRTALTVDQLGTLRAPFKLLTILGQSVVLLFVVYNCWRCFHTARKLDLERMYGTSHPLSTPGQIRARLWETVLPPVRISKSVGFGFRQLAAQLHLQATRLSDALSRRIGGRG